MGFIKWMLGLAVGVGIIFASGWEIVWAANPVQGFFAMFGVGSEVANMFAGQAGDYLIDDGLFLIRFDTLYYGIQRTNKFFNSPAISNVMLGLGVGMMIYSMRSLYKKSPATQESSDSVE